MGVESLSSASGSTAERRPPPPAAAGAAAAASSAAVLYACTRARAPLSLLPSCLPSTVANVPSAQRALQRSSPQPLAAVGADGYTAAARADPQGEGGSEREREKEEEEEEGAEEEEQKK